MHTFWMTLNNQFETANIRVKSVFPHLPFNMPLFVLVFSQIPFLFKNDATGNPIDLKSANMRQILFARLAVNHSTVPFSIGVTFERAKASFFFAPDHTFKLSIWSCFDCLDVLEKIEESSIVSRTVWILFTVKEKATGAFLRETRSKLV